MENTLQEGQGNTVSTERDAMKPRVTIESMFSPCWWALLKEEFDKPYMVALRYFLASERKQTTIYPEPGNIFRALKLSTYDNLKVIIVGQDPYHDGSADGLSFSVKKDRVVTPSLKRILAAIGEDVKQGEFNLDAEKDLSYLASQGVLLINRILTVRKGQPLSHKDKGWEQFTLRIIASCNVHKRPLVFMLWGKPAQALAPYINPRHLVIKREHPVAGVYSGTKDWNHDNCFSTCNEFLEENGIEKISW